MMVEVEEEEGEEGEPVGGSCNARAGCEIIGKFPKRPPDGGLGIMVT